MSLYISGDTLTKLQEKHGVTRKEVADCISNLEGPYVTDDRAQHQSNPPTYWFIAMTNNGRKLKIVFILDGDCIRLKTAYEPNEQELMVYARKCRQLQR